MAQPSKGDRVVLSVRVRSELRAELHAAARAAGRDFCSYLNEVLEAAARQPRGRAPAVRAVPKPVRQAGEMPIRELETVPIDD